MRGKAPQLPFAGAMLCLLGLSGCAGGERQIERRIDDAVPVTFGSARVYRSHVSADLIQEMRGRIGSVSIIGADVQSPSGLLLDELRIEVKGVVADRRSHLMRSAREARFTFRVGRSSLEEWFAGEAPEGEEVTSERIVLTDGAVEFTGVRKRDGRSAPFDIVAPVNVSNGEVAVRIVGPYGDRVSFPDPITTFFTERLQSGIELRGLPIKARIDRIAIDAKSIAVEGSIDTKALVAVANERAK